MASSLDAALFVLLLLLLACVSSGLSPEQARGIAPEDLKHYEASPIWCKDRSNSFPISRLNDDFCDCLDGTDEPGTSACREGRFYCKNEGDSFKVLFSSQVNDGICDCCDGSDEYDGKANCSDSCWEAGRKSREKLEKKIATFKEGARLRARDIEDSKQLRIKEEKELAALRKEEVSYKEVVNKLKAQVDAIEEAERLEREKREKQEREQEELTKSANDTFADAPKDNENTEVDSKERDLQEQNGSLQPDSQVEGAEDVEANADDGELKDSEDLEGLSKEEVGRLVAARWTGEKSSVTGETAEEDGPADNDKEEEEEEEEEENYTNPHEIAGQEDEGESQDVYESTDHTDTSGPTLSWWQSIRRAPRALLGILGLKRMRVNLSDAERIRNEYNEAMSKLSGVRSKLSHLESKLKHDFGKEGEFFSLYDRCFEKKKNKYVYKVCPFKTSTQEEGYSSTRLGTWKGLTEDHRFMEFADGDSCWNGPQRSLKVRLKCAAKTELLEVDEPSRCEYAATLSTPALCLEARLQALEKQLKGSAAATHDEL